MALFGVLGVPKFFVLENKECFKRFLATKNIQKYLKTVKNCSETHIKDLNFKNFPIYYFGYIYYNVGAASFKSTENNSGSGYLGNSQKAKTQPKDV